MLPVEEVLPSLLEALEIGTSAVLVAPPGAGKSTLAPLRFLDAPWLSGRKILMLEPRRLAARAVAARLAANLGEAVGATVGFRVRMESRVSAATRLEVMTEGVFTRRILSDPGLEDVGLVIFDEFHERSLDADLGLALARDAQSVLRPDLRILVMSGTLDGAAVAGLLGGAPVLSSEGRTWPVETRYLGRDPGASVEDQAARAVRRALSETPSSLQVRSGTEGAAGARQDRHVGAGVGIEGFERRDQRVRGRQIDGVATFGAFDRDDRDAPLCSAGDAHDVASATVETGDFGACPARRTMPWAIRHTFSTPWSTAITSPRHTAWVLPELTAIARAISSWPMPGRI